MNNTDTALTVYSQQSQAMSLVSPLVDAQAAKQAIQQYEALKQAIVQPSDVFKYQGKDWLRKPFWRRVATCFGLSLDLVSEQQEQDEKGQLAYSVLYRATAPNGRTMIGDGYCSRSEPGRNGWTQHTVRATAHTRAKNRAISDLVGGGEVSAEEVEGEAEPPRQPTPPAARQQPAPRRTVEADEDVRPNFAPPAPAPSHPAGDISRAEFIAGADRLGLTPKAAMDKLGVTSLTGLHLRLALDRLAGVIVGAEEVAPAEDAAPAEEVAPAVEHTPPSDNQIASIQQLCTALGRDMPTLTSFDHAAHLGRELLAEARAAQAESKKRKQAEAAEAAKQSNFDLRTLPTGKLAS